MDSGQIVESWPRQLQRKFTELGDLCLFQLLNGGNAVNSYIVHGEGEAR